MQFRNDVNALRAIAVLAVVVFHFQPNLAQGGFVGVDIFFVISGFLMTNIIMRGIYENNFSLLSFYGSRIRRIVPALIFMCGTVLIVGFFILLPQDYEFLGKHVRDSVTFISNYTYEREAGYFDQESKSKWILHTWSLSVEWQFYLIYPILLLSIMKSKIKNIKILLFLITILSFFWCLHLGGFDRTSVYYQLTSRAWELLVGSLAYFYCFNKHSRKINAVGWMLIISSVFFIDEHYVWPSNYTLIPIVGTLFVLLSNQSGSFSNNYFVRKIGLFSYSIYLWHWPIVVGINYFELSGFSVVLGILLSFILGAFSYHVIEPVGRIKGKNSLIIILLGTIIIYVISSYIRDEGFPNRFTLSKDVREIYSNIQGTPLKKCSTRKAKDACRLFSDNPSWAVFGDSHSFELAYALGKLLEPNNDGVIEYSRSGCPLILNDENVLFDQLCAEWRDSVINEILLNKKLENIVMINRYNEDLFGKNELNYPILPDQYNTQHREAFFNDIETTIARLSDAGKKIWLVSSVPELGRNIYTLLGKENLSNDNFDNVVANDLDYQLKRNSFTYQTLEKISNYSNNVTFISIRDVFCDHEFCYAVRDGIPLYRDDDHPSLLGATLIGNVILDYNSKSK